MKEDALAILGQHRIMAVATLRPDGWPQTTLVGYAHEGLTLYFAIFRSSQKFANIARDDRVAIAVGSEPRDIYDARAVYAGAHAQEVVDAREREAAWRLLSERHGNLAGSVPPDRDEVAVMRAQCRHVSIVDYTKGLGHTEWLTVGGQPG